MVLYYYNAKLDRVVDGDTIDAMVDLGSRTADCVSCDG